LILTHYTLSALAAVWDRDLRGATLADAYSQQRDELALAVEGGGEAWTLAVVARPELRLLFRNTGHGRARRNTASLFAPAVGRRIEGVATPERDRPVVVSLEGGLALHVLLFGPRPNVLLAEGGVVIDALSGGGEWEGAEVPAPRAAPRVETYEAFAARWQDRGDLARSVARAMPLFDQTLAEEAVYRAEVSGGNAEGDRRRLFEAALSLEGELAAPRPCLYWRGPRAEAFALVPLRHLAGGLREEPLPALDDAVRVYAHRALAQERFDARYRPLAARLRPHADRLARSAERMMEELAQPSRAETYERFGHLLMAQATALPPGQEAVSLPDLMGDGAPVEVPLDPALSGVENAERYYDRARRTRAARAHAEARWEDAHVRAERASALLTALDATHTLPELEAFLKGHGDELEALLGAAASQEERLPYRRFPLPGGYEAWVGKHARGNAELTTRHARPYDLWLHARGVPGAHVVVRRPSRTASVPRPAVEAAAQLAAYYSEARTSALVPVQVTERKHVRPMKGAAPGAVRVEREEVLLVEPARPG
jgi:predicted ribosome quality control (RQC) complex YloA/Tae2 family protein